MMSLRWPLRSPRPTMARLSRESFTCSTSMLEVKMHICEPSFMRHTRIEPSQLPETTISLSHDTTTLNTWTQKNKKRSCKSTHYILAVYSPSTPPLRSSPLIPLSISLIIKNPRKPLSQLLTISSAPFRQRFHHENAIEFKKLDAGEMGQSIWLVLLLGPTWMPKVMSSLLYTGDFPTCVLCEVIPI